MNRSPRIALRLAAASAAGALALAEAGDASAHDVGLSRGDYVAKDHRVDAVIAFARREAIAILPEMDADRSESLSDAEVSARSAAYAERIFEGIVVERDGAPCKAKPTAARLVSEDGIDAYGAFECEGPTEGATLTVRMPMLATLASGHRHLVKLSNGGKLDEAMLHKREASFTAKGGTAPVSPGSSGGPVAVPSGATIARHAALRVVTGREHAALLVGLALPAGLVPRRQTLITGATLLGSCALALLLAGRGVVSPSPRVLAPLLALGVAYVGVEVLVARPRIAGWRIALPFGLAYGFVLARAFAELSVPDERALGGLLLFCLGATLASAAVLGVAAALATTAARQAWFTRVGLRACSALLLAVGVYGVVVAVRG